MADRDRLIPKTRTQQLLIPGLNGTLIMIATVALITMAFAIATLAISVEMRDDVNNLGSVTTTVNSLQTALANLPSVSPSTSVSTRPSTSPSTSSPNSPASSPSVGVTTIVPTTCATIQPSCLLEFERNMVKTENVNSQDPSQLFGITTNNSLCALQRTATPDLTQCESTMLTNLIDNDLMCAQAFQPSSNRVRRLSSTHQSATTAYVKTSTRSYLSITEQEVLDFCNHNHTNNILSKMFYQNQNFAPISTHTNEQFITGVKWMASRIGTVFQDCENPPKVFMTFTAHADPVTSMQKNELRHFKVGEEHNISVILRHMNRFEWNPSDLDRAYEDNLWKFSSYDDYPYSMTSSCLACSIDSTILTDPQNQTHLSITHDSPNYGGSVYYRNGVYRFELAVQVQTVGRSNITITIFGIDGTTTIRTTPETSSSPSIVTNNGAYDLVNNPDKKSFYAINEFDLEQVFKEDRVKSTFTNISLINVNTTKYNSGYYQLQGFACSTFCADLPSQYFQLHSYKCYCIDAHGSIVNIYPDVLQTAVFCIDSGCQAGQPFHAFEQYNDKKPNMFGLSSFIAPTKHYTEWLTNWTDAR